MRFGDMNTRVLFLSKGYTVENELNESETMWTPVRFGGETVVPPPFAIENHVTRLNEKMKNDCILSLRRYGVWAHMKPASGREYEEYQKIRAEVTYKVKIRFFPGLTSEMRMLCGDRIYKIESVLNLQGTSREMQLICVEVDDYGKKAD